jgi:hypothetical protein
MTHNLVEVDADLRLHSSHDAHLPFSRAEAPPRSRVSLMQRPRERLEDVRSRFGRRLTLPGIEISDVESDVRPRLIGKFSKSCINTPIYQCFD